MPHSVVYPGDLNALIKKWKDEVAKSMEKDFLGLDPPKIADGECARLPQALTSVGATSRWQGGERVIDVARTLKPGTVIANFWFEYDKMWFPNTHGYHAALFVRAEGFSVATGKPSRIWMFDQWRGNHPKSPGCRYVNVAPQARIEAGGYRPDPCDDAAAFYVVMVP